MANLPESSTFDAGVYQIETTDPVVGGPSGVTNTPLKNLANRTKYLKDHVDALETNYAPKANPAFTGNPTAPTAPLFDEDNSIANTAFVQRALGNYSDILQLIDQTYNLTAADSGKVIVCGGNGNNVYLPALSSLIPGVTYTFFSQGGTTNVYRSGSDNISIGQNNNNTVVQLIANEFFSITAYDSTNYVVSSGSPLLKISGFEPAGMVGVFAMQSAPAGWMKANGAAISRSVYSSLFNAIGTTFGSGNGTTTFNIPDLRGEFLRGFDDGRGVDAGRVFGSAQSDMLKSHYHELTFNSPYSSLNVYGDVSMSGPDEANITLKDSLINPASTGYTSQLMTKYVGGAETRPRNIALLACIKF